MVNFKYKQINNKRQMGRTRPKSAIKFIVIHYTGNPDEGANAERHYKYLQNAQRYGSAHYYVDDSNIIQTIGDTIEAYSVGDDQGYGRFLNGCTNYNSISIEMCINSDGDFSKTYFNTVELTKELLRQYPNARVCRHWDVSRKKCPGMMYGNNNPKWNQFLQDIKKNRRMIIDTSKTSDCRLVGNVTQQVTQVKKEGNYFVLTNTPSDVLNVREQANATSRKVSSYRDGSKIYVHEVVKNNNGTWYKIEYSEGRFGYVSARYCKGIQ